MGKIKLKLPGEEGANIRNCAFYLGAAAAIKHRDDKSFYENLDNLNSLTVMHFAEGIEVMSTDSMQINPVFDDYITGFSECIICENYGTYSFLEEPIVQKMRKERKEHNEKMEKLLKGGE